MLPQIVPASQMAPKIVQASRTVSPTVQDNRTRPKIVVQHLARDSRTMALRIAPVSRTTTHVLAVQETGMCHAPAVRTMPLQAMPFRTMAAQITMLPAVQMRMLLGPELLITGLLLRKLVMLPGTMVVQRRRKIATFLHPTITMFPVRHLPLRRSSSLGNTRARVRRTIALRNRHKRGRKIIVLRKFHKHGPRTIGRQKLPRQGLNSQRVHRRPGSKLRRNPVRTWNVIRRLHRPGRPNLRRSVSHGQHRHRNARAAQRRRHSVKAALPSRNAKITRHRPQKTKTKSLPGVAEAGRSAKVGVIYRPAFKRLALLLSEQSSIQVVFLCDLRPISAPSAVKALMPALNQHK